VLRRRAVKLRLLFSSSAFVISCVVACSSSTDPSPSSPVTPPDETPTQDDSGAPAQESGASDAAKDSGITGECAKTFGNALTEGFGRIDGLVYAVQKPSDTQCVLPNSDHLVLQVLMNGAVYRMVVNVLNTRAGQDPKIRYAALPHAMLAPAYAEGWHTKLTLDYATTLDAHVAAFTPYEMNELVAKAASELVIGAPVSVYATSGKDRPESAHLVHRNKNQEDGAIVVGPTSASPKFLLFHFPDQTF
jgi:hypothetical protein